MLASLFCPATEYIVSGVNDRELSSGRVGVGEKDRSGIGLDMVFVFWGLFAM